MRTKSGADPDLGHQASIKEAADAHGAFKNNIRDFLTSVLDSTNCIIKPDVFPLVFSDLALIGHRSGGALWGDVTKYDRHYYISRDEADIFNRHRPYLEQLYIERPMVCEFGPGDVFTLAQKTMPIVEAVNASRYVAIDVNKEFASKAASHIGICKSDLSTQFICGDYKEPHQIGIDKKKTSLGLFLGCSADQYPLTGDSKQGETTFRELLGHFGDIIGYNSLLIVTTDANTSPSGATDCYSGQHVKAFLNNWLPTVMAHLACDPDPDNNYMLVNGNPYIDPKHSPVLADSRYEESPLSRKNGRMVHSLYVKQPITIVINGTAFELVPGTQLDIGFSEKRAMPNFKNEIRQKDPTMDTSDWQIVKTLAMGRSIQALVLAGKDTPVDQLSRAKRTVTERSVRQIIGAGNNMPGTNSRRIAVPSRKASPPAATVSRL